MSNRDRKAYYHQYYLEHREKYLQYSKEEREKYPDKVNGYKRKWHKENPDYNKKHLDENPKLKRATRLAKHYKDADKKRGRYEGTNVTPTWIIEHIFSGQVCYKCGESDWTKLGCDRLDNSKPHTEDNIRCCCRKCNVKGKRK